MASFVARWLSGCDMKASVSPYGNSCMNSTTCQDSSKLWIATAYLELICGCGLKSLAQSHVKFVAEREIQPILQCPKHSIHKQSILLSSYQPSSPQQAVRWNKSPKVISHNFHGVMMVDGIYTFRHKTWFMLFSSLVNWILHTKTISIFYTSQYLYKVF